jgi:Ca2+:H+ antiporter
MKEASNPQTTSHGGTPRSSRRPDSSPVPVSASFHDTPPGPEPATHGNGKSSHPLSAGPAGAGGGLASPAADPDSNSSRGAVAVKTPQAAQPGAVVDAEGVQLVAKEKKPLLQRFWRTFKQILFCSKLNVLLVFVPVGIAVSQIHGLSPGVVFAMNAIAIVPLAGLLSFATESVAHKLGDSLGALLNVTFGNAVELIIL